MEKKLDYYLSLPYTIELRNNPEEGWFVRVKELPGCMSQGETAEEAIAMIRDAMLSWIDIALEDGDPIPEPQPEEEYSGKFVLRVPRSLHRKLVEEAEKEGVSLNAFCSAALAAAVSLENSYSFRTIDYKYKSEGITASVIFHNKGIGGTHARQLKKLGISTNYGLLERGNTPKGRQEIAEKSGISEKLILEWVNQADLFRLKGVGEEYSDLLESAGVDTVVELAQQKAENLYEKLVAVNQEKKLVRKLPTLEQVKSWVEQAKKLPRVVTY